MGSAILDACRTTGIAMKEHGFDNARPSVLRQRGRNDRYPLASQQRFTDEYVGDVQRGLKSCKVSVQLTLTESTDRVIDVLVLSFLFHLLESNVEQPHFSSRTDGTSRDT